MNSSSKGRPDAGQVHDEASLARFVADLEAVLHDLSVRRALCWWDKYTGGPGEGLNELEKERSEIMLDPSYQDLVEKWAGPRRAVGDEVGGDGTAGAECMAARARAAGARVSDPLLARRLEVLRQAMLAARVSCVPEVYTLQNEIESRVIAFRPVVGGREVSNAERVRILRQEPDRALRREAWVSIAPLSMEVAPDTVELLRRRNRLARQAGYPGYVDLALELASLTRAEVLSIIGDLEKASAAAYRAFLEEAAEAEGLDEIEPWDVTYLVEKATAIPTAPFPRERIVPSLEEFVRAFGQDPATLGIRIVFQDIPFGGLCIGIDPPSDVRVLANPQDGHNYFQTLFHEYGHSLHAVFAGTNSQLLQDEPGVFCEGMAEVLAWFTFYPQWLRSLGLEADLVDRVVKAQSIRMMARHRSLAADVVWEYRAYDDPGQDLTGLAAAVESRYLLAASRPIHRWAGGPFPAGYPVYRQNYILADLIAAATHRTLGENYGEKVLGNPEVFEVISKTYWSPGASKPWREKLRELTGRDLDASAVGYE